LLLERGTLNLDAPVATMLDPPPYQNPWSDDHQVTTAQLLEHTAGLNDLSAREFEFNEPLDIAEAFNLDPSSRQLA
jgi:CubicO group peptidase (beta-lactamase class C family)